MHLGKARHDFRGSQRRRPDEERAHQLAFLQAGAITQERSNLLSVFEGGYSPYLNLALFSPALGRRQPDWPANTVVTGFPFYDRFAPGQGMPPELEEFLQAGAPPLVFTLGSSAVMLGDDFYVESARAAQVLGRRAVLLVGQEGWNRLPRPLPIHRRPTRLLRASAAAGACAGAS